MTPKKAGVFFMVLAIALGAVQWVIAPAFYFLGLGINSLFLQSSIYGIMIVMFIIFILVSGERPAEFLGFRKFKASAFFLTILYSFLTYPAVTAVAMASNLLFSNPLTDLEEAFPLIATIIFTFVCAPVFEELAFRGVIFQGMRKSGRVAASIILSSLAFGLFHGNLTQFIYASLIGVFAALLMEAGGSIWLTMLYHLIFNFLGSVVQPWFFLSIFNGGGEYSAEITESMSEPVSELASLLGFVVLVVVIAVIAGAGAIGLFLSAFVLKGIKKVQRGGSIYPERNSLRAEYSKGIINIPLIIGIVIYAAEIAVMLLVDSL